MSDNRKKSLLSEATVRRFQTLANLDTMKEGGGAMGYASAEEEEEEVEVGGIPGEGAPEGLGDLEGEDPEGLEGEDPEGREDPEGLEGEELGGLSPEAQAIANVISEPVVDAIAAAISSSPEIDVEVSDLEGEEGEEGEDLEGGLGAAPGPPPPAPGDEGENLALESVTVVDDEELVSEIARRVAKRLLQKS